MQFFRALESFVYHLFSATAFESDFVLASGHSPSAEHALAITALPAPDLGRSQQHYLEYINLKIPSVDEPVWLGLPPRADRLIRWVGLYVDEWLSSTQSLAVQLKCAFAIFFF